MKKQSIEIDPKLLDLAVHLQQKHPQLILVGSLALNLLGIATRRPPGDLDFNIPFGKPIPDYDYDKTVIRDSEKSDNDVEYCESMDRYDLAYAHNGYVAKVNIFQPLNDDEFRFTVLQHITPTGLALIKHAPAYHIVQMKCIYAMAEHPSAMKHRDDVIYMLNNIENYEG